MADTSVLAGHSLRLADADGHVCAAQPKGALDVASVDGAVITLATPLTAGGSSADCVLVREVDPCAQVAVLPSASLGQPSCSHGFRLPTIVTHTKLSTVARLHHGAAARSLPWRDKTAGPCAT